VRVKTHEIYAQYEVVRLKTCKIYAFVVTLKPLERKQKDGRKLFNLTGPTSMLQIKLSL
jgi:hypothetical protein